MNLIIRKAAIADASAITQAHIRSWKAAMEGFIPAKAVEKFCASRPQRWQENLSRADHTAHVALLEGKVMGWFSFGPCRGDFVDDSYYHLYAIYIDPDFQRRGIGRQMITYAEARARELGKTAMILKVFAKNKSSRRFYEACGYHRDGRGTMRHDYGRRLRVLRYVKEL